MACRLTATLVLAAVLASAGRTMAQEPFVAQANQIFRSAGLPQIPEKAAEVQCYAWSGLSAGVYATFLLDPAQLPNYLQLFPKNLEKFSPIPAASLPPPNPAAPWFQPASLTQGSVSMRGQIVRAAPEIFRL